jgi:four helix bundle protein
MSFDHERLDVYQAALDFVVLCEDVLEQLPRGRAHLADQLARASISIVLNIAEGAGKYHKPDKRRFYLTACGSATESAAVFDICSRLELIDPERHRRGKELLNRVVAMLVKLATALEAPST